MRRLHNHPQLHQIPFVLYQQKLLTEAAGLTSLIVKPASTQALWAAIQPAMPEGDRSRGRRLALPVIF